MMMQTQQLNNFKSGLTFSLNDVNFDNSCVNLVPVTVSAHRETTQGPDESCERVFAGTGGVGEARFGDLGTISSDNCETGGNKDAWNTIGTIKPDTKAIGTRMMTMSNTSGGFTDINGHRSGGKSSLSPVGHHWYYCNITNGVSQWRPFSIRDSSRLERRFTENLTKRQRREELMSSDSNGIDLDSDTVSTDGGRYDVRIEKREKSAVFWEETPMKVRRASWFYRTEREAVCVPYSETESEQLEQRFQEAVERELWHQPFQIQKDIEQKIPPSYSGAATSDPRCIEDRFVFHSINTMVEYRRYLPVEAAGEEIVEGRVVYRGTDGFRHHLEAGESDRIDHLVLVVHGIGPVCDMSGRNIIDCVKSMRRVSAELMRSHFSRHDSRIEFLPVCWHEQFHQRHHRQSSSTLDTDLARISLKSVPKLRQFSNSTLIDALSYSSPIHCRSILAIVTRELNRLRHLFASRRPDYDHRAITVIGHSLGSMIAFDLARLQSIAADQSIPPDLGSLIDPSEIERYQLEFELGHVFCLGSPVALLITARGGFSPLVPSNTRDRSLLPRQSDWSSGSQWGAVFNIFHPFDPVAYRLEPLLVQGAEAARPVTVAHHKGRKRMHLELRDNLTRVSNDIKERLVQTLRSTWRSLQQFATAHTSTNDGDCDGDGDVIIDRVLRQINSNTDNTDNTDTQFDTQSHDTQMESDIMSINIGRRIDYVLQEAPLESFNDYLFALGSHACYWESEDTVLMILKEIYKSLNIMPDYQPYDSSTNFTPPVHLGSDIKPMSNLSQPPPILPTIARTHNLPPAIFPPTFQTMNTKPFFQPNLSSEQSIINSYSAPDGGNKSEKSSSADLTKLLSQSTDQQGTIVDPLFNPNILSSESIFMLQQHSNANSTNISKSSSNNNLEKSEKLPPPMNFFQPDMMQISEPVFQSQPDCQEKSIKFNENFPQLEEKCKFAEIDLQSPIELSKPIEYPSLMQPEHRNPPPIDFSSVISNKSSNSDQKLFPNFYSSKSQCAVKPPTMMDNQLKNVFQPMVEQQSNDPPIVTAPRRNSSAASVLFQQSTDSSFDNLVNREQANQSSTNIATPIDTLSDSFNNQNSSIDVTLSSRTPSPRCPPIEPKQSQSTSPLLSASHQATRVTSSKSSQQMPPPTSMFHSRPLVPQSGKLFKKK